MPYYSLFIIINILLTKEYEDMSLYFFKLPLSSITTLMEKIEGNKDVQKIYFLIMFCLIPIVLFQLLYYFQFQSNIYYEYNDTIEQFVLTDFQLKGYKKLIPYLIKNKKTIFDLADDDPEALKLLNS